MTGHSLALCIDPGSTRSGVVLCRFHRDQRLGVEPIVSAWDTNDTLIEEFLSGKPGKWPFPQVLVVEVMKTVFGGAKAADQLVAQFWAGQFYRRWRDLPSIAGEVKDNGHERTCEAYYGITSGQGIAQTIGTKRGKKGSADSLVRRAIIDMYGGDAAHKGIRCPACKGKGWVGRGRPECEECSGKGWDVEPGAISVVTKGHCFRALAVGLRAYWTGSDETEAFIRLRR